MVVAPFLAWVWGAEAALGVMAIALGATSYLALDAARGVSAEEPLMERRFRLLGVVNGVLAVACLAVLLLVAAG